MNNSQRAAAERLIAEHPTLFMNDLPDWCDDAFHLLRELAAEPVVNQQMTTEPVHEPSPLAGTMAEQFLQVVAGIWHDHPDYSIRQALDALNATFPAEPVPAVTECADDDSPWLVCKPCAAAGKCEKEVEPVQEPVAALHDDGHFSWKSDAARRQFDSKHEYAGWSMDVYAASPQQRKPLTDEQIDAVTRGAIGEAHDAYRRIARAIEAAHGITGETT